MAHAIWLNFLGRNLFGFYVVMYVGVFFRLHFFLHFFLISFIIKVSTTSLRIMQRTSFFKFKTSFCLYAFYFQDAKISFVINVLNVRNVCKCPRIYWLLSKHGFPILTRFQLHKMQFKKSELAFFLSSVLQYHMYDKYEMFLKKSQGQILC